MNTEIKSAEEILKDKINNHRWGYNYSNIESTDGTMNDFLNIALSAMESYHAQFKQPVQVSQKEVSDMANNIITVINNNTRDNIKESIINGINFLLSKSYPNHSK